MRKKIYIFIMVFFSLALAGAVIVNAHFYNFAGDETSLPDTTVLPPAPPQGKENSTLIPRIKTADYRPQTAPSPLYPAKLRIPSIGVSAEIEPVGLSASGNMTVPGSFAKVGWWKYGTIPGGEGSAVIDGHVSDGFALPAIFHDLSKLKEGDDIYVENFGGETIHFKVTRTDIYDYNAFHPEVFHEKNGSYLKLITCTGDWLSDQRTHNERLVVSAVKV